MNILLVAIAFFALAGLPSLSVQAQADAGPGMRQMAKKNPEMMKQMMDNPHHLLAMAYHDNLMTFSHSLMKMAKQGETVPQDFARTAVAEMRRSVDELERHRSDAMRSMPAAMKEQGEMHKKMEQHLLSVKGHIRDLEELTKKERIPSQEVMKHLNAMMAECAGMECGPIGDMGVYRHGHGHGEAHDGKALHDCSGCPCDNMPRSGAGDGGTSQMNEGK